MSCCATTTPCCGAASATPCRRPADCVTGGPAATPSCAKVLRRRLRRFAAGHEHAWAQRPGGAGQLRKPPAHQSADGVDVPGRPVRAARCLKAGAHGYANKAGDPTQLITAVKTVVAGRKYLTPEVAQMLADSLAQHHARAAARRPVRRELQTLVKSPRASACRTLPRS